MSRFHPKGWAPQRLCFTQDGQTPWRRVPSLSPSPYFQHPAWWWGAGDPLKRDPTCYCRWLFRGAFWPAQETSRNPVKPDLRMLIATPEPSAEKKGTGPCRTSIFVGAKKEEGEKRQKTLKDALHLSEWGWCRGEVRKGRGGDSAEMSGSLGNPLDPPVFTKMFTALYPLGMRHHRSTVFGPFY